MSFEFFEIKDLYIIVIVLATHPFCQVEINVALGSHVMKFNHEFPSEKKEIFKNTSTFFKKFFFTRSHNLQINKTVKKYFTKFEKYSKSLIFEDLNFLAQNQHLKNTINFGVKIQMRHFW